jgi:glucan phosphorylase
MPLDNHYEIAYFSMEIELESDIPTYSGGLGVLAGDMLRSAADIGVAPTASKLRPMTNGVRKIGWSAWNP